MSNFRTARVLFTQQLIARRRSFVMWVIVWSLLLLLFATVFNSLSKDAAESSKVFQQLPSTVFSSFNIDPTSYLSRIESFISGQFLSVYLLAGSIFSFSMGVGAIGKTIESRTIATLLTKPLSRKSIYTVKALVSLAYLALASAALCSFSLIVFNTLLQYQDAVSTSYFVSLFGGSFLLFVVFSLLGQLLGTVLNGGRAMSIGAGIIVVSWFVNNLAELAHIPFVVQLFSLFHYFDVAMLRTSLELSMSLTLQLVGIIVATYLIGCWIFTKKNIYI